MKSEILKKSVYCSTYYNGSAIDLQWHIQVSTFKFYRGTFIATVPSSLPELHYRDELFATYKHWILEKTDSFTKKRQGRAHSQIETTPTSIQIKEQNKYWGNCTPEEKVLLN